MDKKELTAADVWAMFAEAKARTQEIERILKESGRETDRRMQETERILKESGRETDRRMQETDRMIKELSRRIGGIDENQGHHAEQFFQDVLRRKLEFGMVKYDEMIPNLAYRDKGVKIEFDIALLNGNSIALIEVKNRIHPNFVKELAEERIEKFREYFLRYSDYSVYLGIAGFSFSDEVLEQASRYGIGIIKQVGEGVEIAANNLRAY
ncbi:MAG: hypothetical protein LBH25_13785 [Fibromonadaceae bacterium]|jgi:hypothetical protein|nr:hypothetical protein [Fibromonadaceae bacterium]